MENKSEVSWVVWFALGFSVLTLIFVSVMEYNEYREDKMVLEKWDNYYCSKDSFPIGHSAHLVPDEIWDCNKDMNQIYVEAGLMTQEELDEMKSKPNVLYGDVVGIEYEVGKSYNGVRVGYNACPNTTGSCNVFVGREE